jgi:hypothetical protein
MGHAGDGMSDLYDKIRHDVNIDQSEEKKKDGPYIPGLNAGALRPLW